MYIMYIYKKNCCHLYKILIKYMIVYSQQLQI